MIERRRFLAKASGAAAVTAAAIVDAPNVVAQPKFQWRLSTGYPAVLDQLQSAAQVEIVQFPSPVLHDLRKSAAEVIREASGRTPMAKKVHASFTKFQALVGAWDHLAEGAYHRLVAGTP